MSVKKTVIGMGFVMGMLTSGAFGATPQVFLSLVDTVLYPNVSDPNGRKLTIRMNNPIVHVGGFSISLSISDPSIINFGYQRIDTVLPYWQYFTDCTPPPCHPDSVLQCKDTCFNYVAPVDTAGTRSSGFSLMQARRLSQTVYQITGIARGGSPGPVLQPGNGVLCRVPLIILPISDTVPLATRQVKIYFDSIFTTVSDSTGNTTYTVEDTLHLLSLTPGTVTVPYSTKGDCNFDGKLTPTDAVIELGWVFIGSPTPLPSPSVADVNCDGLWTPADVVLELNKIFMGGAFPC